MFTSWLILFLWAFLLALVLFWREFDASSLLRLFLY